MQLEITETHSAAIPRMPVLNIRWSAIFAGLAVGLAVNMLLMMAGAALGLAFFEMEGSDGGMAVPLAASIWNTVSMVLSAFVGGYVAARGSGLKRTSDGVLHAVSAWGMTLLLATFMAGSVSGATFNAMFPSLQERNVSDTARVIGSLDEGNRQVAVQSLQRNLGISEYRAQEIIDQALALSGREEEASERGRAAARETLRTATVVSAWLTVSTLLSLLAALGGGVTGASGSRRVLHRHTTHIA